MPTTSASKAAVRSISVEDKTDVRKWVNYSAHYSYKVAPGGIWLMFPSLFVHPCALPLSFLLAMPAQGAGCSTTLEGGGSPCMAVDESAPS